MSQCLSLVDHLGLCSPEKDCSVLVVSDVSTTSVEVIFRVNMMLVIQFIDISVSNCVAVVRKVLAAVKLRVV